MSMRSNAARLLGLGALVLAAFSEPCSAQTSAAPYTYGYRYDAMEREVGRISPDPDGASPNRYAAMRSTYDSSGRLWKVETGELANWQSDAISPKDWSQFTVFTTVAYSYNAIGAKLIQKMSGGTDALLTQYSYDSNGHLECTAVRMNPAIYGALPTSACTLGAQGSQGPDRITKSVYDAAGQLIQVRKAVGITPANGFTASDGPLKPLEEAYATYSYTPNGKQEYVIDAKGNRAKMEYDGFDRPAKWIFPSTTIPSGFNDATQTTALASAGSVNAGDYEQYGYDANGNRTTFRKRDGSTLTYAYDALNRMTTKAVPERTGLAMTHTRDVHYGYDLQGHQIYARFDTTGGEGVTNSYDGFGRLVSSSLNMDTVTRTIADQYDADGNRTQITYPDTNYMTYDYDGLDRPKAIYRGGSVLIASYGYNAAGERDSFSAGLVSSPTIATSYGYDGIGRLMSLANNPAGSPSYYNSYGFAYNPANQITSLSKSNNAFVFSAAYNVNRGYTVNGLNQYGAAGGATFGYDANGNLTSDGFSTFTYDIENRLVSASGQKTATLRYDPLGRLYEISGGPSGTVRFVHDGDALTLEYDGAGNLLRRYAHGADGVADDPIAWYEGAGFSGTNERLLRPDWQGSIALVTDTNGSLVAANRYDEYGIPQVGNTGRFQYTGQAWIPDLGMSYYKARFYSPTLGRFLQTDPIGYKDQINLYAYVGDDPVNGTDPAGNETCPTNSNPNRTCVPDTASQSQLAQIQSPSQRQTQKPSPPQNDPAGPIVVTARRAPSGLGGGPFTFADSFQQGGLPFYGVRINGGGFSDTLSFTRRQALSSAKYINGVAQSAQPVMVYTPGVVGGGDAIGLDSRSVAYYIFLNASSQYIGIREDLRTSFQPPHFNSGLAGSLRYPSQELGNHSYFGGK